MLGHTLAHYKILEKIGSGGRTVHSVEEADGVRFITMELVKGKR